MVTAVLFVQNATPATITTFHDLISNELPQSLGPWSFELKIFLNNKYSRPSNIEPSQVPNKYLYTLQLSYLNDKSISIINNTKSIVSGVPNTHKIINYLENSIGDADIQDDEYDEDYEIAKEINNGENGKEKLLQSKLLRHIEMGCCNNLSLDTNENFDFLLTSKLNSLWTVKQSIKGEGGFGYLFNVTGLESSSTADMASNDYNNSTVEKFKLRTSNCFLHGAFKGFLIEIEHLDGFDESAEENEVNNLQEAKNQLIIRFTKSINKIKNLIDSYKFPEGNLCFNVLNDSKLDYMSDLCQQYCDALQF